MSPDVIGWAAALVLFATISSQVYQQWKTRATSGVSPWLFGGQVLTSAGFTVYSWMLGNPVFVVTNALILVSAIVGQVLYWRNAGTAPALVDAVAGHASPTRSKARKR